MNANIDLHPNNSEAKTQRIIDHMRKKAKDPNLDFERSETGKVLIPNSYWHDPYYEIDRIVHQGWHIVRFHFYLQLQYQRIQMWLIGLLILYESQQSREITFSRLFHHLNKKWDLKIFFTFSVLRKSVLSQLAKK